MRTALLLVFNGLIKLLVAIFAVIGFVVVAIAVYFLVETWYFDRKSRKQNSKKENDYDRGFRDGQIYANM